MTPTTTYKQRRKQTLQFLTQDETRRLFKTIKKLRDRAIFLTAYRHGLRASEVGVLQRSDLDLKSGRITIQRLKGSISGVYPLQPDLLKLLRRYLRSREDSSPALFISNRLVPIDRTTLWRLMQKYGAAALLPTEKREIPFPTSLNRDPPSRRWRRRRLRSRLVGTQQYPKHYGLRAAHDHHPRPGCPLHLLKPEGDLDHHQQPTAWYFQFNGTWLSSSINDCQVWLVLKHDTGTMVKGDELLC